LDLVRAGERKKGEPDLSSSEKIFQGKRKVTAVVKGREKASAILVKRKGTTFQRPESGLGKRKKKEKEQKRGYFERAEADRRNSGRENGSQHFAKKEKRAFEPHAGEKRRRDHGPSISLVDLASSSKEKPLGTPRGKARTLRNRRVTRTKGSAK